MSEVVIAGSGMTRFGKFPEATMRSLAEEATREALADANARPENIDIVFFSNATAGLLSGQEMIRGQVALRNTGLLGTPIVNVENACASASSALHLALLAVRSGEAEVALAVGSEKLTHPDKTKSFAAIGTAVDLLSLQQPRLGGSQAKEDPDWDGSGKTRSSFMDIYAAGARAYMSESGATEEDFAQVSVKSHQHAALNPKAQYREPLTVEEVLASREVAWPLTVLMCSPVGDGAAALLVCSEERARSLGVKPVHVRACVLVSGTDRKGGEANAVSRAASRAYEKAGVGPGDLDVLEIHDAAAPAELTIYEDLQLCERGRGPGLLRSGATWLGGRMPVNPSGGLLSKGHPIGATGCAQVVELVDQLRGRCGDRQVEGAHVALAENAGGSIGVDSAAAVVTILACA